MEEYQKQHKEPANIRPEHFNPLNQPFHIHEFTRVLPQAAIIGSHNIRGSGRGLEQIIEIIQVDTNLYFDAIHQGIKLFFNYRSIRNENILNTL